MKQNIFTLIYAAATLGTTLYLTFFDGYIYTWWNWLIAVPVNIFLGTIWPIYWAVLHWVL